MTGRMQALAQELVVARERAGLAATPLPTATGGAQQPVGSISSRFRSVHLLQEGDARS